MARFKDKKLNKLYQHLVGKTPDELLEMKIFGTIYGSFKRGYEKLPQPSYMSRGTPSYAAYVAGKETKDITKVIQDLIVKYNKTPVEINAGECEDFAMDVIKQMGGYSEDITDMAMPIESEYFGHVWIKYKGKHYDALHPGGVKNWKDLFEKTKDHRFGD